MSKFTSFISILLSLTFVTLEATLAQPSPPAGEFVPGEVIVKFEPQLDESAAREALRIEGLTVMEFSSPGGLLRAQVEPGREIEMLAKLRVRGDVEFATLNYYISALGDPNDPGYSNQWGLNNTGQLGGLPDADLDAPEAWDIYTGGDNVTIAIIDTGIDLDHPDLQANLVPGFDFVNDDPLPNDDNGHGTHVAGIAAALGNNNQGIAGVSWRAKMMPLKVLDAGGTGTTFKLAQAIYHAADNGANIINMSLGAACTTWPDVEAAVGYAVSKGVLLIAASGNANSAVFCPASMPNVMAVGATDVFDLRWEINSFQGSNYGDAMDVTAPGEFVYSSVLNGGYSFRTGTSMASPYTAGLAALVWSFAPSLTNSQVDDLVRSTSDDLGAAGWDPFYGQGRINAWRALDALNLQTPARLTLFIDDNVAAVPTAVQIASANPDVMTWTATLSPSVAWLGLPSSTSGPISAASSPVEVALVATRPLTYGTYVTTLVVTGTTGIGAVTNPRETEVRLIYIPKLYRSYLPLLLKR